MQLLCRAVTLPGNPLTPCCCMASLQKLLPSPWYLAESETAACPASGAVTGPKLGCLWLCCCSQPAARLLWLC
jgi:hypothetical protein